MRIDFSTILPISALNTFWHWHTLFFCTLTLHIVVHADNLFILLFFLLSDTLFFLFLFSSFFHFLFFSLLFPFPSPFLPSPRTLGVTRVVNCTNGVSRIPNFHQGTLQYYTFMVRKSICFCLLLLFYLYCHILHFHGK